MSTLIILGLVSLVAQIIAVSRDIDRWETVQEVILRGMK